MNIPKCLLRASLAGCAAISVCAISMADANAANVVLFPNADLSTTPYVISLDGGAATFTFTDINDAADTFIDAVSTGGNAMVIPLWGIRLLSRKTYSSAIPISFPRSPPRRVFSIPTVWSALVLISSSPTAFTLVMRPYSDPSWFNMATTQRRALRSPP